MFDWGDVRYALALARSGSLSAAARSLKVDHTTVARRVDSLETAFGVRLFDRLARGWRVTAEGEAFVAWAAGVEEEALALERRVRGLMGARGAVRISAPPVFASHFLAPRLQALRRTLPDIDIELVGETQAAHLNRREADIALRLSDPEDPGLVARRLATVRFSLYGAASYVAGTESAAWTFLRYDSSLDHVPQDRWTQAVAAGRPTILRTNDLATLHQAVRAGMGMAALPRFLGDQDPALVRISGLAEAPTRPLWLLVHPDVRRSPRVRAIIDALADIILEHRHLLTGERPRGGATDQVSSDRT